MPYLTWRRRSQIKFVLHGDNAENEAQKQVHQPAQEAEEEGDRAHRHLNATHGLGEDHLGDTQGEVDEACDLVPQAIHQAQDHAQCLLSDGDDGFNNVVFNDVGLAFGVGDTKYYIYVL